jgi:AraC-like DNA-binding protein
MTLDVRTLAATYYGGYHIEPHTHPWGQLIYAESGVMRVEVGDKLWIVPPERAIWAPARMRHEIWAQGKFAMRTLYLAPRLTKPLSAECYAIEVVPLLREIILHIVGRGMLDGAKKPDRNLIGVLLELLRTTQRLPLSIRMPTDRRARAVAELLFRNPGEPIELRELAREIGASPRTLQRLFAAETGVRFGQWRQRLRLLHAVTLLGSGSSVTDAGLAAGYGTTSAFIAAFRKQLGSTPLRFRSSEPARRRSAGEQE